MILHSICTDQFCEDVVSKQILPRNFVENTLKRWQQS